MSKKALEIPVLGYIPLHEQNPRDVYYARLENAFNTRLPAGITQEIAIFSIPRATFYLGIRSFGLLNDGIELYAYSPDESFMRTSRYSLAAIEFQSGGYARLVFHMLVAASLTKTLREQLVTMYNAVLMAPFYQNYSLVAHHDHICIRDTRTNQILVPIRIDSARAPDNFVLTRQENIVDSPTWPEAFGSSPSRYDRWHTKFLPIVNDPPATFMLNEYSVLSFSQPGQSRPIADAAFNPDHEVRQMLPSELA